MQMTDYAPGDIVRGPPIQHYASVIEPPFVDETTGRRHMWVREHDGIHLLLDLDVSEPEKQEEPAAAE